VLKNEVILALKRQWDPPAGLESLLIELHEDKNQDVVIRDYALQHLSTWYESAANKESILQLFWGALQETDSSIAGTALLALYRLDEAGHNIDVTRLRRAALRMAEDQTASDLSRISAIQVCGRLKLKEALPAVVSLAQESQSVPLRISALAAMGELGERQHQQILERISEASAVRLKPAAQLALNRLKQKFGQ